MTGNTDSVSKHADDRMCHQWLMKNTCESYLFLAAIMTPPVAVHVRLLRNESQLLGNNVNWFNEYDDVALLRALQVEHTRLFVSAIPGLEASPYAASYLVPHKSEALLVRIRDRLSKLGLEPLSSNRERLDHIAVLLEAAGLIKESRVRCVFVAEFLRTWIRSYSRKIETAAALPLYPAFIAAAVHLVDTDSRSLNS